MWPRLGKRAHGQSLVEYLIGCAVVTAVVAVPIDGHNSLLTMVLQLVRVAFNRFTAALSIAW